MKCRLGLLLIVIAIFILMTVFLLFPVKQVLTFQETRVEKPIINYSPLENGVEFQIRYTHSIHLSDVVESYAVTAKGDIQLLSMSYEHLGVGMPGYAEEGQTIDLKDGRYTLSYEDEVLPQFTLYIGDIDMALELLQDGKKINLKEQLERGKSYVIQAKKLSLYEMMKGVKMYGKATGE